MSWLEQADRIGALLIRDAWWAEGRCTWFGDWAVKAGDRWRLVHGNIGADLYEGAAGIALFLGFLASATGGRAARRTAVAGAHHALTLASRHLDEGRGGRGLYVGGGGVVLSALLVADAVGDERLHWEALALGLRLASCPAPSPCMDLLSGAAGGLLVALDLARRTGQEVYLAEARRYADEIVGHAARSESGVSWGADSTPHLAGISHGASGVALALAEAREICDGAIPADLILEAVRFERSLFSEESGNWRDVRPHVDTAGQGSMLAWCHGAPGIGLARLRLASLVSDWSIRRDLDQAYATTERAAEQLSDQESACLCHGGCGNLELLIANAASNEQQSFEPHQLVRRYAERLIERDLRSGPTWPCGTRAGGITPGLMLGWAGIGYFFLRMHDPVAIPSVLLPSDLIRAAPGRAAKRPPVVEGRSAALEAAT